MLARLRVSCPPDDVSACVEVMKNPGRTGARGLLSAFGASFLISSFLTLNYILIEVQLRWCFGQSKGWTPRILFTFKAQTHLFVVVVFVCNW